MFLSKDKNGFYYLYYTGVDGKRKRKSTSARYKADALEYLRTFKFNHKQQIEAVLRIGLSDFQIKMIDYSKSIHKSKTTLSINTSFNEFIRVIGNKLIREVNLFDIEKFISEKVKTTTNWSVKKYVITLSTAFNKAMDWNYITENPFRKVKPIKTPDLNHSIFTKEEFNRFIDSTERLDVRELFYFALLTGMRLGEILNIKFEDIDINKKIIKVCNKDDFQTKTNKNRIVPLNNKLIEIVNGRENKVGYLFGVNNKRYTTDYISTITKRIILKSGINPKLHFHSLRHTFATWLIEEDVNIYAVSKMLGHSSVTTTQKFYTNVNMEVFNNEVNKLVI